MTTEQYFGMIAARDLNADFKEDIVLVGGNIRAYPLTAYMLGNGNGTLQRYQSLPAYGAGESFPFVRDINFDSRHDIGAAWDGAYGDAGSSALVLVHDSAKTNCDPPLANALSVNVCAHLTEVGLERRSPSGQPVTHSTASPSVSSSGSMAPKLDRILRISLTSPRPLPRVRIPLRSWSSTPLTIPHRSPLLLPSTSYNLLKSQD